MCVTHHLQIFLIVSLPSGYVLSDDVVEFREWNGSRLDGLVCFELAPLLRFLMVHFALFDSFDSFVEIVRDLA